MENGRKDWALMHPLSEGLVYVDEHILVLDKPAGLLAVPGRGEDKQDCLAARAQRTWPDALVVHRLDMATSGLVVMARNLPAQRRLSLAFERREVGKRYVAVVAGQPRAQDADAEGWSVIDLPLGADWEARPLQQVDHANGRPSTTRWRAIAYDAGLDAARLELEPRTGRSHQLRVHLKAIGHPILGDPLYASPEIEARAPRLLLHAAGLQFFHPASGEPIAFESAPPF